MIFQTMTTQISHGSWAGICYSKTGLEYILRAPYNSLDHPNPSKIATKQLENHRKTDCKTYDHFWDIVMVNLWKRYAQKLHIIILLQFELVTFRFACGRTLKPLISMILGFSDVSLNPKAIIFIVGPPDTSKNPKIPKSSKWWVFCLSHKQIEKLRIQNETE